MLKGFKDFLMRGNVIDLAVAVVMGTAFTAVVSAVTKGVVEPLLAVAGGNNQLGLGFHIVPSKPATFVALGPIISAAIDFVMVAAVLYFVLILPMNHLKKRFGGKKKSEPTETELLTEIRDLLAAQAGGETSDGVRTSLQQTTTTKTRAAGATAKTSAHDGSSRHNTTRDESSHGETTRVLD